MTSCNNNMAILCERGLSDRDNARDRNAMTRA